MAPMSNRLLVPRKTPGLLDLVPGAAAAYSLRSLSNSYAGPVVTVRRSSDDAEEDFTAAEVADGTLAAFCGAGDGFVKTWLDQSGNARNATQTTAGYQPKVVDSGVVVLEEGKPAIQFDGTDDRLEVPSSTSAFNFMHNAQASLFFVARFGNSSSPGANYVVFYNGGGSTGQTGVSVFYGDSSPSFNDSFGYSVTKGVSGTLVLSSSVDNILPAFAQSLCTAIADCSAAIAGDRLSHYVNGAEFADDNTATAPPSSGNASEDFCIGAFHSGATYASFMLGTMQEIIIYPSDLTAQRELVEGLIAWGYSV